MSTVTARMFRYALPLRRSMSTGRGELAERSGYLIRLEDADGRLGWGEVAPLPGFSGESDGRVRREVENVAAAAAVWADGDLDAGYLRHVAPSVRFGMEIASLWLKASRLDVTLATAMGGSQHDVVRVNALVSSAGKGASELASALIAAGYGAVKLKVGRGPVAADIVRVRELAGALGAGVQLRLDANRAWALDDAVTFFDALEESDYAYVEEPLRDPLAYDDLDERCQARIALDETLHMHASGSPVPMEQVTAVVIKPTLLGGLGPSHDWLRIAAAKELSVSVSSALESGVGLYAMASWCSVHGGSEDYAGLDTQ